MFNITSHKHYYDRQNILNSGRDIYYFNNNGERYEGEMKNNMREGSGIYTYFDFEMESRCYYDGEWKNNKRDGIGWEKQESPRDQVRGSYTYDGEFKNDMREGKGHFWFRKNLKEDFGISDLIHISFLSGSETRICKYNGDWKNNKRNGKGIEIYDSWNNRYEGDFKNDMRDGKGVYFDNNDNYIKLYDGDWKNGLKEGLGIEYDMNGNCIYVGEWKNDMQYGDNHYKKKCTFRKFYELLFGK